MIPTVGFNMRKITKGNVTIKVSVRKPKLWAQALGATEAHLRACWDGAPTRKELGRVSETLEEAGGEQGLGEVGKERKTSKAL